MTDTVRETSGASRNNKPTRLFIWAAFLLFLVVFAGVYSWLGTRLVMGDHQSQAEWNQRDYLDAVFQTKLYAKNTAEEIQTTTAFGSAAARQLPHFLFGRVDPLWPWIISFSKESDPDALFLTAKKINVMICGVALILLGLVSARAFSFLSATCFLLVGGIGYLLDRAAVCRIDGIVFLLTVLVWICLLSLLRHNSLWKYGMLGFLLGFLFLANSLISPLVIAFCVVTIFRSVVENSLQKRDESPVSLWSIPNQIVGLAICLTIFMIVAGPRLSYANENYGNAFHRYDDLTMWLSSRDEADSFRSQFPGKAELSALTKDTRPGLQNFFLENGLERFVDRALDGAREQSAHLFPGNNRSNTVARVLNWRPGLWLIYFASVFFVIGLIHRLAALKKDEQVWRVGQTSSRWVFLFAILTVIFSIFWIGLGHPANADEVVIPALYLPILLTFVWISERFRRQLQRTRWARFVNHLHVLAMILPITFMVTRLAVLIFGGEDRLM